jgi:soluble lytic murein transglycosylase-like protein
VNPFSPPVELVALAFRAAEAHALWPEVVCAIVEQESSWNPWALRYEPAFYEKYVAPQFARGNIADLTESRARAFSWGLMQVMGQAAREHGFNGASLAALCDPAAGIEIGCRGRRQRRSRAPALERRRKPELPGGSARSRRPLHPASCQINK